MFTKTLIAATAFIATSTATTEIANSCLSEHSHLYGQQAAEDLPFTDYSFLANSEKYNTVYRMNRFVLCNDQAGDLTGMRSIVTRYGATEMKALSIISMNKIGTTDGTGISCSSMALDAVNGEYLSEIIFGYEGEGQIDYVKAISSYGQQISKGSLTSSMITQTMTDNSDNRILAFWGYENSRIAAVGQVQVDLSCIKGVTTVETVEEPILIDVTEMDEPSSATNDDHMIYYILGGVIGFIMTVALTACCALGYSYRTKKGCFKKSNEVNVTQTMPIENFVGYQGHDDDGDKKALSFKGRAGSMMQRASMKSKGQQEMSDIEHHRIESLNESADIEASQRKHAFKIEEDVVQGSDSLPTDGDQTVPEKKFSS